MKYLNSFDVETFISVGIIYIIIELCIKITRFAWRYLNNGESEPVMTDKKDGIEFRGVNEL